MTPFVPPSIYIPSDLALVSTQIAKELYEAGAGRILGIDAAPFIRVLSTINHVQYDSINVRYKDQQLLQGNNNNSFSNTLSY